MATFQYRSLFHVLLFLRTELQMLTVTRNDVRRTMHGVHYLDYYYTASSQDPTDYMISGTDRA